MTSTRKGTATPLGVDKLSVPLKAGAVKGIWKVAGKPEVIAIMDMPN